MASVVCQGLQSCLEPRLIEPLVIRHILTPPRSQSIPWPQNPNFPHENSDNTNNIEEEDEEEEGKFDHTTNKIKKNGDLGGWNFLDALANPTKLCEKMTEKVYVHPMEKSSASALSMKSLEMCTESLGCETGSDISESSDEFCTISWEKERLLAMQRSKTRRQFSKKVVSHSSSFPPPLTSISGSDAVRVKPHREGGRLVLRAVNVTSSSTNFQAERTNGSLKLSLIKECSMTSHNNRDIVEMKEEIYNKEEDEEEEEVYDEEEGNWDEDMDGNVGCEIGIGELSKPSRCKEGGGNGNKGLSNWGSFWVPIS